MCQYRFKLMENNNKINKAEILLCFFIFITICFLLFRIKTELGKGKPESLNLANYTNEKSILELKNCSDMGWYNLKEGSTNYEKGLDIVFLCFQYMLVPTVLENNGFNKKIICYYTSPEQLDKFCQKKKKYRLVEKNIFTHFALLERKD